MSNVTTWFQLYEFISAPSFSSDNLVTIVGFGELTHLSVSVEDNMMRVEINNSGNFELHPKEQSIYWSVSADMAVDDGSQYADDSRLAHFGTIAESRALEAEQTAAPTADELLQSSIAHADMKRRAIELAMQETQASRRVYVFLANMSDYQFRAATNAREDEGLDTVLRVSPTTIRKVLHTQFGMKADGRGWYRWTRPEWLALEAQQTAATAPADEMSDAEAESVLNEIAYSALDELEAEQAAAAAPADETIDANRYLNRYLADEYDKYDRHGFHWDEGACEWVEDAPIGDWYE